MNNELINFQNIFIVILEKTSIVMTSALKEKEYLRILVYYYFRSA